MGQCVLRDLGFEFEKDPEKTQMLDEYLRDKLRAKYPQAQSYPKQDEDFDEEIPTRSVEPANQREKSPRVTRQQSSRTTTQIEKCIQTEMESEESFTKSHSRRFESRSGSKLFTQHSNDKLEITPKNEVMKDYRRKSNNFSNAAVGTDTRSDEKNYTSISKNASSTPTSKQKSEPHPIENKASSKRSLFASGKENIFDGIEHIDFNSPVSNNLPSTTNRSRRFRGFENKYFRPSRGRSPSPMTEDANIFDDDEEGGYQYEDDMH